VTIVEAGHAFPQDLALIVRAAEGDEGALSDVLASQRDTVARLLEEGRAAYGDLGLNPLSGAKALARLIAAVAASERSRDASAVISIDQIVASFVLQDVYLAESLLHGCSPAWARFEEELDAAYRNVRSHFLGQTPSRILEEIRESVLGTFYMEGKVATYRATAPISAWARQVIFNLFLQAIRRARSGRDPTSLSQLMDGNDAQESLLPPSREPPPPDVLGRREWHEAFLRAVPEALEALDRDERRMLEVLPTKRMTQVQLAQELGVSPFRLNRWYKEVRQRFQREVTHRLRLLVDLDAGDVDRLVAYLATVWGDRGDLAQP
jgi:RNA polymerase sigma factor (sigma-70 family)